MFSIIIFTMVFAIIQDSKIWHRQYQAVGIAYYLDKKKYFLSSDD